MATEEATTATAGLPIINLTRYLNKEGNFQEDCSLVAQHLQQYGILLVHDPRVSFEENDKFIDMMEKYYEQPREVKLKDARPEVYYQVGVTPDGVEKARSHCDAFRDLPNESRPATLCPPERDPKWRYFWRIGARPPPEATKFHMLNAPEVIPEAFPDWEGRMTSWGAKLLQAALTCAAMASLGLGLAEDAVTKLMHQGPHLLAPTGSDLSISPRGTVLASLHYDLNFLSAHGPSRFPGLYVWTRDGKKLRVVVPSGCLLLQAGKQFEWLTGGEVLAGFHEVAVTDATLAALEKAKAKGASTWRVSSTLFSHVASDQTLQPLGKFATTERMEKYPPILAGEQVEKELAEIKLGGPGN